MASLTKRNGVWSGRFRHNGKEYFRSTGIAVPEKGAKAIRDSKEQARAELHRIMVEIKGGESVDALLERLIEAIAKLPASEQKFRRIAIADRLRNDITTSVDVEDAWDLWLEHPNRGNAGPATVEMYQAYWGRKDGKKGFVNWLKKNHPQVKRLHEINRAMAEEYAATLKKMKVAPRTYNGAIKFLASLFRTLTSRAGLVDNVWEHIARMPKQTAGRRNLTNEELKSVCEAATGDYRYLFALGIYTGLRLGDCVTLKWDAGQHVNGRSMKLGVLLDEQVIRLIPHKTKRTQKVVTVPIHPVLLSMLYELRAENPSKSYLFPTFAKPYLAGKADQITNRIQKLFINCGIETTEKIDGRKRVAVRVGFHSLRHSFVSLCAANNVPQHAIQELVGHGFPAMTMLYSHADDEQKASAINVLPALTFADAETAPIAAENG